MAVRVARPNMRSRASENLAAFFLVIASVASVGASIAAASNGMIGRTAVAAGMALVLFVCAVLVSRAGMRNRNLEKSVLVYAPDFPGALVDVDLSTLVRSPHSR